ncbi:19235_t:CDS:2 [Racocetra fulgida]|uniref:19235_t:CDS:1 n=1 Tax=Racocetra fulgida TaxID=60492 RepID=A0A9N9F5C5_9GLOM|nr:19235_t:CDS:2 [Racocetra fulgida]
MEMGKSKNKRAKTQSTGPRLENEVVATDATKEYEIETAEQDLSLNSKLKVETLDLLSSNKTSLDTRSEMEILSDPEVLIGTEGETSGTNSEKSDDLQDMQGKAIYTTFASRNHIRTKNENVLIFDIRSLNKFSINEIILNMYTKIGDDFIAAKLHFTNGRRTHMEIIFANEETLKKYAIDGHKEFISNQIREAFEDIGSIISIKLLVFEGTPISTNQWVQKNLTVETTTYSTNNPYIKNHPHEVQETSNQQGGDILGSNIDPSTEDSAYTSQALVEEKGPENCDNSIAIETNNEEIQIKDTLTFPVQSGSTTEISESSMNEDLRDASGNIQDIMDDGFTLVTGKKKDSRKEKSPTVVHERQSPYKRPKRTEVHQALC